jgi:predicted NAD/FAD-dependent oxidoreductase
MQARPKIAIIGAGLSGIMAGRHLSARADVTIFEKSRGLGGRMSTRRAEPFFFDHGAQYFTAKSADFAEFLAPLVTSGHVARWTPRQVYFDAAGVAQPLPDGGEMYVAVPAMNALCKHLGADLKIETAARVASMAREGDQWTLALESGETVPGFDWVLSTAPAEQSQKLMPEAFAERESLHAARMSGCFTLMLGFEAALTLPWEAARFAESPLGWVALNSTKPGREGRPSLVLQSTNHWAEAHMEDDLAEVEAVLTRELARYAPDLPTPAFTRLHRWRFAAVETPVGAPFLFDRANRLAAAGDWCLRARVEAAFESGSAVGEAIAQAL